MVRDRSGKGRLGCLLTLLLVSIVAYVGLDIGEASLAFYRFRDAMQQEAHFSRQKTDAQILTALRAKADSLGLPVEAKRIRITRGTRRTTIWSDYSVVITLPRYPRDLHFHPRAEETF